MEPTDYSDIQRLANIILMPGQPGIRILIPHELPQFTEELKQAFNACISERVIIIDTVATKHRVKLATRIGDRLTLLGIEVLYTDGSGIKIDPNDQV